MFYHSKCIYAHAFSGVNHVTKASRNNLQLKWWHLGGTGVGAQTREASLQLTLPPVWGFSAPSLCSSGKWNFLAPRPKACWAGADIVHSLISAFRAPGLYHPFLWRLCPPKKTSTGFRPYLFVIVLPQPATKHHVAIHSFFPLVGWGRDSEEWKWEKSWVEIV